MDLVKLFNDVGRIADALEKIAGQGEGIAQAVVAGVPAEAGEEKQKRTRRTKAEIAAEAAAAAATTPAPVAATPAPAPAPVPTAAPVPPISPENPAPVVAEVVEPDFGAVALPGKYNDDKAFIAAVNPYVAKVTAEKVVGLIQSYKAVDPADNKPKLSLVPKEQRENFVAALESMLKG